MKRRRKITGIWAKILTYVCDFGIFWDFYLRKYDVVLCVTTNHNRHLDRGGCSWLVVDGCHFSIWMFEVWSCLFPIIWMEVMFLGQCSDWFKQSQSHIPLSQLFHSIPPSAKSALPAPNLVPGNPIQLSKIISSRNYEAFMD